MSQQTWQETLVTAQSDGPTLATFTTAVTILPTHAIYTLPANYFYVGRMLKMKAWGRMSSFTSGTFTFNASLGPTLASPISVWTPGAITTIISLTNITWELEVNLTCRTVGSGTSATVMGVGRMTSGILTGSGAGGTAGAMSWMLPTTAPAVGSGFDSTVTNIVNLFCACSVSNAANGLTLHEYSLTSMN